MRYLVKVFSTKTKCTTFDVPRFENYTHREESLLNLPLASHFISSNLYRSLFNIQEQNRIFNNTRSHSNPHKFSWGIDGDVMFRQDKMLLSMLKHYTLRDMGANRNALNDASVKKWRILNRVLQREGIMRNLS